MLSKRCIVFLAHMISKVELDPCIDETPMVQGFLDIFPKKLLGLASEQEIKFNIELVLGITPISKILYIITLVEL